MKHLLELGSRRYTTKLKMYTGLPGIPAAAAFFDILILGMLFFARSGKETRITGFQVEMPRVKNAVTQKISFLQKNIIALVPSEKKGKTFEIFFRDRPMELADLQEELQKLEQQKNQKWLATLRANGINTDLTVLLMIDRSIAFEHIAPVLAAISKAGLKCYLPVSKEDSKDQSFEQ